MSHGDYGVFGSSKGEGTSALDFYSRARRSRQCHHRRDDGVLPAVELLPLTPADVGFVDFAGRDYPPHRGEPAQGSRGDKNVGADIDDVLMKTKGVAP
jgi:hypothetical protein